MLPIIAFPGEKDNLESAFKRILVYMHKNDPGFLELTVRPFALT